VAVALLSLAVVAGVSWGRVSNDRDVTPQALDRSLVTAAAAATTRATVDPAPDWPTILDDLDAARAAAFANADTVVLGVVDAPGSPALASDRAAVRALAARNLQARGFRIEVVTVQATTVGAASAVLDVTDRRQPYELVGADGSVVATQPGRGPGRWRVELVLAGDTWLVRDVKAIT